MWQPTHVAQTNGLLCSWFHMALHRLFLSFAVSFILSFFLVFCSACKSYCPPPPLMSFSVRYRSVSGPGQTKMTIVNGLLLGWMAALICSMQATGWQQHMCWWQPHTGQTLALYNTSHCTPVSHFEVRTNPRQNNDVLLACTCFNLWLFGSFFGWSRRCHKVSSSHVPQWDLAPLTLEVSGRISATCPHPPTEPLPLLSHCLPWAALGQTCLLSGMERAIKGWREMERDGETRRLLICIRSLAPFRPAGFDKWRQ